MNFSHDKPKARWRGRLLLLVAILIMVIATVGALHGRITPDPIAPGPVTTKSKTADAGKILSRESSTEFDLGQVETVSRQDYGHYTPSPKYAVKKTTFSYRSYDTDGTPLVIYARAYQPIGSNHQPIFGFASGTTGIGDECAPSLEDPAKANWANYDSHMLTYAGQGYASVITDYEGMRDPKRIHHYMVGELEGRAVLDSVRALIQLDGPNSHLDTSQIFLGGYSQGGHSVFWADQIAQSYAPELHLKGVIGFGAVIDVGQTLTDVTHAANINWFGPYVLTSYADYYHDTYPLDRILLPQWTANLTQDVLRHCIDTDLVYWGHDPAKVYTPEFNDAMRANNIASISPQLADRLATNLVGAIVTKTPKLLNGGAHDNVVLPSQQQAAKERLCHDAKASVQLHEYPTATHYDTMSQSFADVLVWMDKLRQGKSVPDDCQI